MDAEPVREGERGALAHIWPEFAVVERGLQLVGRQHHDDVGPFRRLGRVITLMPAASAFCAEAEPGRSATTTSLTPLSRRLLAWALPWLP